MATPIPANRASFTIDEIAVATRGTIVRRDVSLQPKAVGVFTDSRAVRANGIFIALSGESHDGHAFVADACLRGAAIAVVAKGRGASLDAAALAESATSVIEVDDPLTALGDLARSHLERWRALPSDSGARRVIAITGSAGKTTTKELMAALLAAVAPTHRTAGNLNNRVGVPMVMLGLQDEHRFAVLEMGMSLPGELDAITAFARPDLSLVTNVGVAHSEGVGGPDGVMREKGAVYRALDENGVAIVNADDLRATRSATGMRTKHILTFGKAVYADYRLVSRAPEEGGGARIVIDCGAPRRAAIAVQPAPPMVKSGLRTRDPREQAAHAALVESGKRTPREGPAARGRILSIHFPLVGEAATLDFVAALATQEAASGTELSAEQIESALSHVILEGRSARKLLGGDIVVLDDTYNANPASVRAALASLAEMAGDHRRVVVLGEMKELGVHAEPEHDALADALVQARVALVIGCGGLVDRTLSRVRSTAPKIEVITASSTEDATREAVARVQPGDVVLVKGSRSVGAEKVVTALQEAWPQDAKSASSPGGVVGAPSTRGESQK